MASGIRRPVARTVKRTPIAAVEAGVTFYGNLLPNLDTRMIAPLWHIYTVGHIASVDLDRLARRFGLSIADLHLLGTVRIDRGLPIRAIDLARTLNVSQAALSVRIERMVRAGLLQRSRQPADKRAFELRLTPRGMEIADASVQAFTEKSELARALKKLPAADLNSLTRIIGSLHEELDRAVAAGTLTGCVGGSGRPPMAGDR